MRGSLRCCGPEVLGCGFGFALLALKTFWSWSQDLPVSAPTSITLGLRVPATSDVSASQALESPASIASDALVAAPASTTLEPEMVPDASADQPIESVSEPMAESRPPVAEGRDRFMDKYQCSDEPTIVEMLKRIEENNVDLKNTVETAFNDPGAGLKFEIRQNQVIMTHNDEKVPWWDVHETRGRQIEQMLRELLTEADLPDMMFAVQPGDGAGIGTLATGSGLMRTEGKRDKDLMWLPRSLMDWGKEARAGLDLPRCKQSKQIDAAVFRGSPTGGCHTWDVQRGVLMADGTVMPRYSVVKLSKDRPKLLNAKFSSAPPDCYPNNLKQLHMVDEKRMGDAAQSCYAAIIVPYGNSVADRLARQLSLGVPIIMMRGRDDVDEFWYDEVSNKTQWFETTLEHLESLLRYIMSPKRRDARAQVGINGRLFVQERLSEKRLKCYIYTLLLEYGKIYRKRYPDT